MRGQIPAWDGGACDEDYGIVNPITADGSSQVTVPHRLGRFPAFGTASVTAPGYTVGFVGGSATTATWWVRTASGASAAGGVFILTWLVK